MYVRKTFRTRWIFLALVLLAAPAAADGIIYNGVDVWRTSDGGSSFMDFAHDPIPAGFFCSGSSAFAGRIAWRGEPLATSPPDVFGKGADTIVHRLDNAVFDHEGVAVTRIRVAALSLVGIAPLKTGCGAFEVRATLAPGEQPISEMRIVRTRAHGGYFEAPLAFNARLTFTPVKARRGERLEIDRAIYFPAADGAQWTDRPRKADVQVKGFALVDTDGDRRPDTFLPGTSNFVPTGQKVLTTKIAQCLATRTGEVCHWYSGESKCHCTYTTVAVE